MQETVKRASWLELFYDIAFIALVAQLTYLATEHHTSLTDVLNIGLIGYTIFIAWWATTTNRNLQPTETATDKLLIQLQMVAVFMMSIFMSGVFAGHSVGFFLALAVVRLLQSGMIVRMYWLHPTSRPNTYNIVQGFFIAAGLWVLSALTIGPVHYLLAASALAIEILVPLTTGKGNTQRYLDVHHLQERLGLFLMLVMGESMIVVALSNSSASQVLNQAGVVFSGLGLMIALWWLYFEHSDKYMGIRPQNLFLFLHAHGFLFGSIILIAAGYKIILSEAVLTPALYFIVLGMTGVAVTLVIIRATLHQIRRRAIGLVALLGGAGLLLAGYGWYADRVVETVILLTLIFGLAAAMDYLSFFAAKKKELSSLQ